MISSTTLTTAGRLTIAATLTLFITLFANAQTVVLEPDRDNTIFSENSAKSNGAGVRLFAGRTNNGNVRRALLHFDITGNVPAGATITSVTLTMNQSKTRNGIARTIDLHKVTTDWGESTSDAPNNEGVGITAITGDATWTSNFQGSSSWTSNGGDFSGTVSGSQSVTSNGSYTWGSTSQMVADVQDWLDNPGTNYGWIVIGDETTNASARRFDSRENATASNRPQLSISYSMPIACNPCPGTWSQTGANIDGEASGDAFGEDVSMSADGMRVAIGASKNDGVNGANSGHARVFEYDGTNWNQLGADIDGEAAEDRFGTSVSISADGTRVAIGAELANAGHIRVYEYNGSNWVQMGADIDGEVAGDRFGYSVSISADGSRVAGGAWDNNGGSSNAGHTRIYEWNGSAWVQLGADIDGEAANDASGYSVSISDDGSRVVTGAISNAGNGATSGHARIFEWNGSAWVQLGADIDGEAAGDQSGYSVSISGDGARVAITSKRNASNLGQVEVYEYDGSAWNQVGSDIEAAVFEFFGEDVALSQDGSRLVAGGIFSSGNGSASGVIRIFEYCDGDWNQVGSDVYGEAADDQFGVSVSISADGSRVIGGSERNAGSGAFAGHARVFDLEDQLAPGGVCPNLALWLKADNGVDTTTGAQVSQWNDQSGTGNITTEAHAALPSSSDVTTPSADITWMASPANFNPAVNFTGANNKSLKGEAGSDWGNTPKTIYAVAVNDANPHSYAGVFTTNNNWTTNTGSCPGPSMVYVPGSSGYGLDGIGCTSPVTTTDASQYNVVRGVFANGGNQNGGSVWMNGIQEVTSSGCSNTGGNFFEIGGRTCGDASFDFRIFKGNIAEVVVYDEDLSMMDDWKVETYLGVKYGIHLAHDYLASDGTVLWDSSAMANYHHDVTGIGVDSATCLDQKQSINGSSDAIVTMGLGSIATDNASNGNTFAADKSFMLWGNNNGATECTNYSGTNASQRWQRVWKIAETNTVGTVEISIPAWYGVSYLLVNNSSNTFGAGTMEIALTSDGNGNMTASHDFADGAFFTFGSGAKPGGVGQNLSLWLKPDGDITVSGTDVTAWNDETGTNNFTVIDTPQYGTAADINFQQIVDFDGTNDRMDGDATITAREVFFVGRPSGVSLVMGPQVSNAGGNVNYFGYVCGSAETTGDDVGASNASYVFGGTPLSFGTPVLSNYERTGIVGGSRIARNGEELTAIDADGGCSPIAAAVHASSLKPRIAAAFTGVPSAVEFAEIIAYDDSITVQQRWQIASYLGIKYGIHLAHSYFASDGTMLWDTATMNALDYHRNVRGIGLDSASCLDQKQSTYEGILEIGLGAIAADNASNANTFGADKSYMLWGNSQAEENAQFSPSPFPEMDSVWDFHWVVREHGSVGIVEVALSAEVGLTYLIVSDDSIFAAGDNVIQMADDGNGYYKATVDFADWNYFTFGKVNPAPTEVPIGGQYDSLHFMPPFYGRNQVDEHYLFFTTLEADSFEISVTDGAGNLIATRYVSQGNPALVDFAGSANSQINMIPGSDLNTVTTEGLVMTASKPFFANIRHHQTVQGMSTTSKGQNAQGYRFRSGHLFSTGGGATIKSHVISFMATTDNTTVTITDYADDGVEFKDVTNDSIVVTLQQFESYTIAAFINATDSNINNVNGTLIQSDRPIVVNTGSWLGGASATGGRDIGMDQIVSTDALGGEYIVFKINSFDSVNTERPIVVADVDNTQIFLNGSGTPETTIHAGEYYVIPTHFYDANNTMFVQATEKIGIFQTTNASDNFDGHGLNFIPPIGCKGLSAVEISEVDFIGGADISIISRSGAVLTVNNVPLGAGAPVQGIAGWEVHRVPGVTGTQTIESDSAIFVALLNLQGARGAAGYFSGFSNQPFILAQGEQTVFTNVAAPINGVLRYTEPVPYDSVGFTIINPSNGGSFVLGTPSFDSIPFTYTPPPGFVGTDSVEVIVSKFLECNEFAVSARSMLQFIGVDVCSDGSDPIPPTAVCNDATVQLDGNGNGSVTTAEINNGSTDNCGDELTFSFTGQTSYTCANIGSNAVVLNVTDANSNVATCGATVTVVDNIAPNALCQATFVQLDGSGNASITTGDVDAVSTDNCGISSMSVAPNTFTCADLGSVTVVLTATDASGNVSTCTGQVDVHDNVAPTILCQAFTAQLDGAGNASITTGDVDGGSNDNCTNFSLSVMPNTFNCGNTGANIVTLSAVDGSGNQAACTATVTVEDTIPPTVLCKDATISLDNGGNVTLTSGDVDNGSSDNCGNISFTFSGQSSFDCNGTGTITATLIVSDANENSASCTSSVTITDDSQPTAVCQDVTLMLDGSGNATLTTSQADNGSSDNCSGLSYSLSQSSYNCSNLGESTVVLTVTDDNSNIATCGSIISVQDNIAPTATCNATTAYLDGTGNVTVDAATIAGASTDNCGSAEFSYNPASITYNCADVGTQIATIEVADGAGNTSVCTASVSVQDTTAPVIVCQPATVNIAPDRTATINTGDIDGGSTDNCGIDTSFVTVTGDTVTCNTLGNITVTLTVVDASGGSSVCTTTVTVQDPSNNCCDGPVAICQPGTVQLNSGGTASITTGDIDNGSTYDCGLQSMSVSPSTLNCNHLDGGATVVLTVTDINSTVSTCSATVMVEDNVGPTISNVPANVVTVNDAGQCGAIITWVDPDINDNCAGANLSSDWNSGDFFPVGSTTVTFTATDDGGNSSTASFTVDITDIEPPVIDTNTCPPDTQLFCGIMPFYQPPQVLDNCIPIRTREPFDYSDLIVGLMGANTDTVISFWFIATDPSGNTDSACYHHVRYLPLATGDGGPDYTICIGDTVQLGGNPTAQGASGNFDYQWTNGGTLSNDTVPNPFAFPDTTTFYTVLLTDIPTGCVATGSATVNVINPITSGVQVQSHNEYSQDTGFVSTFPTLAKGDKFGRALTGIGDVNGDGFSDMIIGAYGDDDGGKDAGAVYICFLDANRDISSFQKISITDGGLTGVEKGDYFGFSVASIGDWDGDSIPDVAVGAARDDDGNNKAGAIYLLFLNNDGTVKAQQKISNTAGGFTGTLTAAEEFGSSVCMSDDIDGDGIEEIFVGQHKADEGKRDQGAVWCLFMNADGTVKDQYQITTANEPAIDTVVTGTSEFFGSGIGCLGDLNLDGVPDIVVGAPRNDLSGGSNRGTIFVLFLNNVDIANNGMVQGVQPITRGFGGFDAFIDSKDFFGESVAGLGDVNNDGLPDIAVGAPRNDNGGQPDIGAVFVLFLETDGTLKSLNTINSTSVNFDNVLDVKDRFGSAVGDMGDVTDDCSNEVLVGAELDDKARANPVIRDIGAAYMLVWEEAPAIVRDQNHATGFEEMTPVAFPEISQPSGGLDGDLPSLEIDDSEKVSVTLFPNPTDGMVHLDIAKNGFANVSYNQATIEVWSLLGERVYIWHGDVEERLNHSVDLGEYTAGQYVVKVKVGDHSFTELVTLTKN